MTKFKEELEYIGKVFKWQPTEFQLQRIANRIVSSRPADVSNLQKIVSEECPGVTFGLFEGVDNSDLRALISLAISLTKKG